MPVTNSYSWILSKMENYSHRSIDVFVNAYMFCVCVTCECLYLKSKGEARLKMLIGQHSWMP